MTDDSSHGGPAQEPPGANTAVPSAPAPLTTAGQTRRAKARSREEFRAQVQATRADFEWTLGDHLVRVGIEDHLD